MAAGALRATDSTGRAGSIPRPFSAGTGGRGARGMGGKVGEEKPAVGPMARRRRIFWGMAGAAFLLALAGIYFRVELGEGAGFLFRILERKENFRAWIRSFGAWGPFVFIGVQILQVVFSPIPGELTGFFGGYIYGALVGSIYSTIGLSAGSCLAFVIGRWFGRPFVEKLVSRRVLEKFDFLTDYRGALLAFVFFSIPGFPKDYLCYLLGLSPLRLRTLFFIATVGRIPGTIVLSAQGASLYDERYGLLFALLLVALTAGAVLAFYREPIRLALQRKANRSERPEETPKV